MIVLQRYSGTKLGRRPASEILSIGMEYFEGGSPKGGMSSKDLNHVEG